jgi:hypothetical protein
LREDAQKLREE